MRAFLLALSVLFAAAGTAWANRAQMAVPESGIVARTADPPGECRNKYFQQPNGPYAVMVFCAGALGQDIVVVHNDMPPGLGRGEWNGENRFWRDPEWAQDVTSLAWSLDGKRLYLGMAGLHGEQGLFVLDLDRRESRRLFPKDGKKGQSSAVDVEIKGLDGEKLTFQYKWVERRIDKTTLKTANLWFNKKEKKKKESPGKTPTPVAGPAASPTPGGSGIKPAEAVPSPTPVMTPKPAVGKLKK